MFAMAIALALAAHWESRRHVLFWLAAVVLVIVHIDLVLRLPWPTWKLSGHAMGGPALLSFAVSFAVMRLIQVAINRLNREASAS
jgi:hypothetical protein